MKGEFITEYKDVSIASATTKIPKDNITNATSGRSLSAGGYIWEKCSPDSPRKNIRPKKSINLNDKKIVQKNIANELVAEFPTVSAASQETGINRKSIRDAINGRQKSAGGFLWSAIKKNSKVTENM